MIEFPLQNKFVVPASIRLYSDEEVQARKFLNLHYLCDEDANELIDGVMVPKHLEKETDAYKEATRKLSAGWSVNLSVEIDTNGNITCEVINENL